MVPERKETNEVNLTTVLACCLERMSSHLTGRGKPRCEVVSTSWAELTGLGTRGGQAGWTSQGRILRAPLRRASEICARSRLTGFFSWGLDRHTREERGQDQETAPWHSHRLSINLRDPHTHRAQGRALGGLSRLYKISPRLTPALAPPNKAQAWKE